MTTWILRILLIALPLAGVFYWLWLKKRYRDDAGALRSREIQLLIGSIVLLGTFVSLLVATSDGGGKPGDFYVPPYEKDGKIVSGQFMSREEARERGYLEEAPQAKGDAQPGESETFGD